MVPNTYLLVQEAHLRREQLVHEAMQYRLRRVKRARTSPVIHRLRQCVGARLVAIGEWLAADAPAMGQDVQPRRMRTTAP